MPRDALFLALILAGGAAPALAQTQTVTGPVATYWMTARTTSGLPMPSAGGGGGAMDMMAAMMGGGGVNKSLRLELESDRSSAMPEARHLAPPGLVRAPLPLASPTPSGPERDVQPGEYDMPEAQSGRVLIYHGCGETGGQPVVITINRNGVNASGAMGDVRLSTERGPTPRVGHYGDWPNNLSRERIGPEASLVGAHRVEGNYTPTIDFTLDRDFLAPVQLIGGPLGWRPITGARAYFALSMGGNEAGDLVLWTSSARPIGMAQMPDVLSGGDVERLLGEGVLLPATTTECAVPQAVLAAAPESMVRVQAFGDQVDIAYPPRPSDPREPWNIEYVVKVRYGSAYAGILGMDEMMGQAAPSRPGQPPVAVPGVADGMRALGGLMRRRR